MTELNQLGTETVLEKEYSAIEEFFTHNVQHHRISIGNTTFLSAIEYQPASLKGTSTLKDSSRTLIIIPGRAETEHKYAELLYALRSAHVRVLICFVRGQGQSSSVIYGSTKCHIEHFGDYRRDVEEMLCYLDVGPNYKLMGFSLGGLISLDFVMHSEYPYKPKALGLIAPFLGIDYGVPQSLLYGFVNSLCLNRHGALAYTPHGKEYKRVPFEENYHSHSPLRYKLYHDYYASHPQLPIAGPSFNFVKCCMRAQRRLNSENFKFTFPCICVSAGDDKVVDTASAQSFFDKHAQDPIPPHFRIEADAFHDILNESDRFRNPVLMEVLSFLFNGEEFELVSAEEREAEQKAAIAAEASAAEARAAQQTQPQDYAPDDPRSPQDDDLIEDSEDENEDPTPA